jgi:hypothetical protein
MSTDSYIKANRKGSREAELSFENGWKCTHKIHSSLKDYTRKQKHSKKAEDRIQ